MPLYFVFPLSIQLKLLLPQAKLTSVKTLWCHYFSFIILLSPLSSLLLYFFIQFFLKDVSWLTHMFSHTFVSTCVYMFVCTYVFVRPNPTIPEISWAVNPRTITKNQTLPIHKTLGESLYHIFFFLRFYLFLFSSFPVLQLFCICYSNDLLGDGRLFYDGFCQTGRTWGYPRVSAFCDVRCSNIRPGVKEWQVLHGDDSGYSWSVEVTRSKKRSVLGLGARTKLTHCFQLGDLLAYTIDVV